MQILGVKVDDVSMEESLKKVEDWLSKKEENLSRKKYFITTPNLEIIKESQKNGDLRKTLNNADLAIPDSSRLSWLLKLSEEKSFLKRLEVFPVGILPGGLKMLLSQKELMQFEVVTGVDLMERLCLLAAEKGFTIGLLGAAPGVAEKAANCLQKKYKNLSITFTSSDTNLTIPKTDILFVALGHGKQEKWIDDNLLTVPVRVAMTVGGAFDYLSGNVPRAPQWMRSIGMEWLFRLIVQPWRITRQLSLVVFLIRILIKPPTGF
jgi:N-acetylglucosaminyldiphosphoundecaprenol N-acetyl-beta-D-mannosaminyltransferase